MNENQKPVNEKYRSNYDEIFKKKEKDEQRSPTPQAEDDRRVDVAE